MTLYVKCANLNRNLLGLGERKKKITFQVPEINATVSRKQLLVRKPILSRYFSVLCVFGSRNLESRLACFGRTIKCHADFIEDMKGWEVIHSVKWSR